MERRRDSQKWLLPLTINITILKSKLMSSIAWINTDLPICYNISKPQKFYMDCNLYRTPLTDAHSKHLLIILVIYLHKKHELLLLSSKDSLKVKLNPNQTHVCCVCRHMGKLCSYFLYISFSLTNVIKEKHHSRKGVQSFTILSAIWKVISPT